MLGQQEPTNLQDKWQHWDEGPGVLRQQCKRTDAVHAQRVETSRWYQPREEKRRMLGQVYTGTAPAAFSDT